MENHHLTNLLLKYRAGLIARQILIREISIFVYRYPYNTNRWKEDFCSDFFCFFYPKIEKMIESFEIRGIPFEAYLVKCIRLQLKTFALQQKEGLLNLYMQKNMIFWPFWERNEQYFCSEENKGYYSSPEALSYLREQLEKSFHLTVEGIIKDKTLKKRVTMLILKNIFSIKEEIYPFISRLIDKDIHWLTESKMKLETSIYGKSERKEMISRRRNQHFYRLFQLHQLINYEAGFTEKEKIAYKIKQTKKKISHLNNIIKNISQIPTHNEIAQIMKIPKGSVDSGLYYLKIYLENQHPS